MVDPSGKTRPVTIALVGLHVVGVTANHPEFLWGTFEQVQNAPDLPPGLAYNSTDPVSNQSFTFYAANAGQCLQRAGRRVESERSDQTNRSAGHQRLPPIRHWWGGCGADLRHRSDQFRGAGRNGPREVSPGAAIRALPFNDSVEYAPMNDSSRGSPGLRIVRRAMAHDLKIAK